MRAKLKQLIESTDTTAGRWLDIVLQVLIVLAVIALSIQTLPDLNPEHAYALRIFTFITLMTGLGVRAVATGLLASALSKARAMEDAQDPSEFHARSNASEPSLRHPRLQIITGKV